MHLLLMWTKTNKTRAKSSGEDAAPERLDRQHVTRAWETTSLLKHRGMMARWATWHDLSQHPVIRAGTTSQREPVLVSEPNGLTCLHLRWCVYVTWRRCWCRRRCLWTHIARAPCTCILQGNNKREELAERSRVNQLYEALLLFSLA